MLPDPETEQVRNDILSGAITADRQPMPPPEPVPGAGPEPGAGAGTGEQVSGPAQRTRSRRNVLPVRLTSLVGRSGDVATACARLLDPETRLLTLVGIGGSGKSRLAVRIATDVLPEFTDGVYFVDLRRRLIQR